MRIRPCREQGAGSRQHRHGLVEERGHRQVPLPQQGPAPNTGPSIHTAAASPYPTPHLHKPSLLALLTLLARRATSGGSLAGGGGGGRHLGRLPTAAWRS